VQAFASVTVTNVPPDPASVHKQAQLLLFALRLAYLLHALQNAITQVIVTVCQSQDIEDERHFVFDCSA